MGRYFRYRERDGNDGEEVQEEKDVLDVETERQRLALEHRIKRSMLAYDKLQSYIRTNALQIGENLTQKDFLDFLGDL